MKHSRIEFNGKNPVLCIGEERYPACAYITYFEERNDYKAFYDRGFRIFSVSVALATQPINCASGFVPFVGGVFDRKGQADFSSFDNTIALLLEACPEALIFPRIYCCMPQWWLDENETETVPVVHGKRREALYSQSYRQTAGGMLEILLDHIKTAPYSEHIFGYQLSGGNTEEWFHCDLSGGYCENALKYFNEYLLSVGKKGVDALPQLTGLDAAQIKDPLLSDYLEFCNVSVAETVEYLCKRVKEKLDFAQIVGVFYGYLAEVSSPLWGTHALGKIIASPFIDFFSSPVSYHMSRPLGRDWADMLPVSSIRLHKKAVFAETDVRTFLTKSPGESREGSDPDCYYTSSVWRGPQTREDSACAMRKAFAKQLTSAHGMWWFDMFGGWFKDEALYKETETALKLYSKRLTGLPPEFGREIAVFADEAMFTAIGTGHALYSALFNLRFELARLGAPFDFYLLSDFENTDFQKEKYKAVIICSPFSSPEIERAKQRLNESGISYLSLAEYGKMPQYEALIEFISESKVHRYCLTDDVLYIGNGFAALHASSEGKKCIYLQKPMRVTAVADGCVQETDCICFYAERYETVIFELSEL